MIVGYLRTKPALSEGDFAAYGRHYVISVRPSIALQLGNHASVARWQLPERNESPGLIRAAIGRLHRKPQSTVAGGLVRDPHVDLVQTRNLQWRGPGIDDIAECPKLDGPSKQSRRECDLHL